MSLKNLKNKIQSVATGACGGVSLQNDVLGDFSNLTSDLSGAVEGVVGSASNIASSLESKLTSYKSKVTSMIPELPEIPSINLQAELASLANLDVGSFGYLSKFASLKSQFGNLIDLDVLGDLKSIDICSLPNLELPSGAGEVITQAKSVVSAVTSEVPDFKAVVTKYEIIPDVQLEKVTEGFTDITENLQSSLDTDLVSDLKSNFTKIV